MRFSAGIKAVVLSNNHACERHAATATQIKQQGWDFCQKQDRQTDRQTYRQACRHVDKVYTNKLVYSFKPQTNKMESSTIVLMAVSVVPGMQAYRTASQTSAD